jgi:hypothetical protein
MRPRIYVDTSVFAGYEDVDFIGHSRRLVAPMVAGDYFDGDLRGDAAGAGKGPGSRSGTSGARP